MQAETRHLRILAYPRDRWNPYQELLFAQLRAEGDEVRYLAPGSRWRLVPS